MLKKYEEPSIEIVRFTTEDVITASGIHGDGTTGGGEWEDDNGNGIG